MNGVALLMTMLFWAFLTHVAGLDVGVGLAFGALLFGAAKVAAAIGWMPDGVAMAGVYVEVWTGELVKQFTQADEGTFLQAVRDYSQYANNQVIHLVDVGANPDVLINNTTYPIEVQESEDGDITISLDKYQTKATPVTDDEMYAASYDKIGLKREQHGNAIVVNRQDKAIHAFAPAGNTVDTPVLKTTGEVVDGRKKITRIDVISLKKAFDLAGIPAAGRTLVLCPDHIADLLEDDQKFAGQYYNYSTGKISTLYGFDIYEYQKCPMFNVSTLAKKAFKAVPDTATDRMASVAFVPSEMFKALGETKMYWSKAENDPQNQRNLINFRNYFIALPKKQRAIGAIVSDLA